MLLCEVSVLGDVQARRTSDPRVGPPDQLGPFHLEVFVRFGSFPASTHRSYHSPHPPCGCFLFVARGKCN